MAEGKNAVSSAVAPDQAEVGAIPESMPDSGATEAAGPGRGSVQKSVPERDSADEMEPDSAPRRPAPPAALPASPVPATSPVPAAGPVRATSPVPGGGPAGRALHRGILGVADRFRDDDGSADLAAAAALSAFAAGTGSEHAVLLALAAARLLVPVVAEAVPDPVASRPDTPAGSAEPVSSAPAASSAAAGPSLADDSGSAGQRPRTGAGEKSSDMALPTLVGRDGRRALPVFTSLETLARWQPSARPMPADAALVWRAAAEDSCAVVIDVAGPVPLAVEGARLSALAQGEPVPALHEDPDIQAAVGTVITEALAGLPAPGAPAADAAATGALVGFALHPGVDGGDLLIELAVAPVINAENLAAQVGSAVLQQLSSRLRRGVALMLSPEPGQPD